MQRAGNKLEDVGYVIGKHGEGTWSDNGKRLIKFCTENNSIIANTIFPHKKICMYTRVEPSKNENSETDYAIIRKESRK
jgi:hypothetical protein